MTPVTILIGLCQIIVIALAIWCQLTPNLRTGSIATLALGGLTIGALMGLARPTGEWLHLILWLLAAILLCVIVTRTRRESSLSGCRSFLGWPPDDHPRQSTSHRAGQGGG